MECRAKKEVSPPTTDLYQSVPPPFVVPFPPSQDIRIFGLAFGIQNRWPTEGEYDKNGIIVEDMDESTGGSVGSRACLDKLIRTSRAGSVPRVLDIMTSRYILAGILSG